MKLDLEYWVYLLKYFIQNKLECLVKRKNIVLSSKELDKFPLNLKGEYFQNFVFTESRN